MYLLLPTPRHGFDPACSVTMISSLFLIFLATFLATSSSALWPLPQQLSTGTTLLRLAPDFSVDLSGIHDAPQDLKDAVARTHDYLYTDKLQMLTPDRGASIASAISHAQALSKLTLSLGGPVTSISEEAIQDIDSRIEDYTLTVPADGDAAVLHANSTLGLFRGLTTFEQLWYDWQGTTYTLQAPVNIADKPTYVSGRIYTHIYSR